MSLYHTNTSHTGISPTLTFSEYLMEGEDIERFCLRSVSERERERENEEGEEGERERENEEGVREREGERVYLVFGKLGLMTKACSLNNVSLSHKHTITHSDTHTLYFFLSTFLTALSLSLFLSSSTSLL